MKKLRRLRESLEGKKEDIFIALEKDLGKSPSEAYLSEYLMTKTELDYILRHIKKWRRPKSVPTSILHFFSRSKIYSMPYGKVGIVVPWNYPFQLAMIPTIEALAGGNQIILKMSSKTPCTSQLVKEIFREVYTEDEVMVYGWNPGDKERFFQEDLDFLFFTGSTKTGRIMAEHGAKLGIPVVLELGGKSPAIVCSSANIKVTAKRILWGKLMNGGQTCVAPDYALVHHSIREEFINELDKAKIEMVGEEPLENPEYPKIIDDHSMKRLLALVWEEGIYGPIYVDEKERKMAPIFFETTVDSPFMKEEIFGPFLPILTWNHEEEVKEIIARHPNPLALYLFTKDQREEKIFFEDLNFGGGCINDCLTHLANHHLPFGGIGQSGQGRYHGKEGFETFTYQKSCLKKSFWPDIPLRYPPFKDKEKWIRKL
ncbi:MAG: aldehyde dehydrogenase family protein [Tissierellia bacterium]|nr:aldehyde dehydrogenase family protein [Tissierellia bacterium]